MHDKNYYLLFLALFFPFWIIHPAGEKPKIETPKPGDILQGVVEINGSTDVFGFKSYEVLFGYESDPTNTWFLIDQKNEMLTSGTLAKWDTTIITDGSYRLMVRVYLDDGNKVETIVPNLNVRNYLPVETSVPTPTPLIQGVNEVTKPVPTAIATNTPIASPSNSATVTSNNMVTNLVRGVVIAIVVLVLIGGFFSLRSMIRRK